MNPITAFLYELDYIIKLNPEAWNYAMDELTDEQNERFNIALNNLAGYVK